MGYISIPKINVDLVISHGTSEDSLQLGAGHIEGTSLPIGGKSTHAVISAHRGLPSAKLFTDLDQIVIGDEFYINILGERFTYKVDQIETVLPQNTDVIQIKENKDLVTLITCTPYGVNTHRLCVRGEKIPNKVNTENVENNNTNNTTEVVDNSYKMFILIGSLVLLLLIVLFYQRKERRKLKKEKNKNEKNQ